MHALCLIVLTLIPAVTSLKNYRTAIETFRQGDLVLIECLLSNVPTPTVDIGFYFHALDQTKDPYYASNKTLSVRVGNRRLFVQGTREGNNFKASFYSSALQLQPASNFTFAVEFRRENETRFIVNNDYFNVTTDTGGIQVVEVSGDYQKLHNFEIDHSARVPILRSIDFSVSRYVELLLTTGNGWTTCYLKDKNNTPVLEVIIKADERLIHLNSFGNGRWGQEINITGKVEPHKDYSLKLVRKPILIEILLNGDLLKPFPYLYGQPRLNLYADPYKGYINRVIEG